MCDAYDCGSWVEMSAVERLSDNRGKASRPVEPSMF